MLVSCTLLLTTGLPFIPGLLVSVFAFTALWVVSLVLENASIVDVFWGIGFIIVAWFYTATVPETATFRGLLSSILVTVWGLRLALHVGFRNAGAGEDFRYRKWRQEAGSNFWWISYFKVFLLQSVILWVVSSPLLLSQLEHDGAPFGLFEFAGVGLWVIGFLFESVADWQLARFKRNPDNQGRILRSGLWSLSRHPNYFGEALLWWGFGLMAIPTGGLLAAVGPVMITFLLLKVSGVSMLDAALVDRRPGYSDYIRSTPAFLPLGSKRRRTSRGEQSVGPESTHHEVRRT
jgi:steroid 5-alpha reductase family enzyme